MCWGVESRESWGFWEKGLTVWVEDRGLEAHLGRHERVFSREGESSSEEATCEARQYNFTRPTQAACKAVVAASLATVVLTAVEFAVVTDHEHDLPFKDVIVHKPTADSRNVLVVLHLFELAGKQACSGRGGGHGGGV